MSNKISDEELLNELKNLKEHLGRNPKQEDLSLGKYSKNAYKRAFGGISKALILIGEKPTYYKGLTRQDIIDEVKRIYNETGEVPIYSIFKDKAKCTYETARTIIGEQPWHLFLKECNIFTDDQLEKVKRGSISKQELIDEVLRLKEKLNKTPLYTDMYTYGNISPDVYADHYGTYTNAMKELGFDDHVPQGSIFKNSEPTKGNDGNSYKSIFEASIANFLFECKNKSLIKDYEYERVVFKKDCWRWTCDFVIKYNDHKELYLECDGMGDKRKHPYDSGNKKIQFYTDNNYDYKIVEYDRNICKNLPSILNIDC